MAHLALSEFADKVTELMPAIMKELYRRETSKFCSMQITIPQFVALEILSREGELRMTDLAGLINVTTAAMTGIVDRLVREGYVSRVTDAADRRTIKVRTTAKGKRVVRNACAERKRIIGKMFGAISQADREEYLRILIMIKERIRKEKGRQAR